MIDNIDDPAVTARLRWLTAEEGGRRGGPPTAVVYAATCVFPLGGEEEVQPRWPATAEKYSILLQEIRSGPGVERFYKAGFLAPDLVGRFLHPGAPLLVTEGPKVVASGSIDAVFPQIE